MDLRREERFSISVTGRYRKGTGVRFDIAIRDLSEYGCQFADLVGRLRVGDDITIRIDEIGPISAVVKWVVKRQCGIEFDEPLHLSVLNHIIAHGGKNEARHRV